MIADDIIWALVAILLIGVSAWLAERALTGKLKAVQAGATALIVEQHSNRLDILERALLSSQKEVLAHKEAITRIENRLGPDIVTKVGRKWPGGT